MRLKTSWPALAGTVMDLRVPLPESYLMLSPRGPRSVVPVSFSSVPTAPLGAQLSALRDPAVALSLTELTNEAIRFRFVIIFESSST
jgi:hypothetical protein